MFYELLKLNKDTSILPWYGLQLFKKYVMYYIDLELLTTGTEYPFFYHVL